MVKIIQKQNLKTIFLFLSFILWVSSNPISVWCFPANDEISIDNYWDLRKIIYSVSIFLIIISAEYHSKLKKFIALLFSGFLAEDISDRLQGITYFQYSDWIVIDLIVLTAVFTLYGTEIKKFITPKR